MNHQANSKRTGKVAKRSIQDSRRRFALRPANGKIPARRNLCLARSTPADRQDSDRPCEYLDGDHPGACVATSLQLLRL